MEPIVVAGLDVDELARSKRQVFPLLDTREMQLPSVHDEDMIFARMGMHLIALARLVAVQDHR